MHACPEGGPGARHTKYLQVHQRPTAGGVIAFVHSPGFGFKCISFKSHVYGPTVRVGIFTASSVMTTLNIYNFISQ